MDSNILGLKCVHSGDELPFATSLQLPSPYGWAVLMGIKRYIDSDVELGDVVHAHLFPTILYLSILKKLRILKATLVYTEHSTSNRRRGKWYGRLIDKVAYAGCDRIVAISQGTLDEIVAWMPKLKDKTSVVQNGVLLPFDQLMHRKKRGRPIVLSVGRICEAKNYRMILKAIALIKELDFEYHIAGDGPELESLRQMCTDQGLSDKVKFLGYVPDVRFILQKADLFLIASRWEGFGLAAVEAMNASLPVIASDIPGLREVVSQDPACAVLVDPDSPESIATALRDLLAHDQKRVEMGKAAFMHSKKFNEQQMVESYMNIYTEVAVG